MPVHDIRLYISRAEKGTAFTAEIEPGKYLLYFKQFSPEDGSELVGKEQVQLVTLDEIDNEILIHQAEIDLLTALRKTLTSTKLTAAQVNAAADKATS